MMVAPIPQWEKPPRLLEGRVAAGKQEQYEPQCPHTFRTAYLKTAMMAALMRPEMGTVTNQAMKMLRKRRQSTAFLERSQPTETTEPTCPRSQDSSASQQDGVPTTPQQPCPLVPRESLSHGAKGLASALGDPGDTVLGEQGKQVPSQSSDEDRALQHLHSHGCLAEPWSPSKGFCSPITSSSAPSPVDSLQPWGAAATPH